MQQVLERMLHNLSIEVEPFALCEVSRGWRLPLAGEEWVTFHYVLEGEGRLVGSGRVQPLHREALAVVPPRLPHALETGPKSRVARVDTRLGPDGLPELAAGPPETAQLVVACGRVGVTYAGSVRPFDRLDRPIVLDFRDSDEMRYAFDRLLAEQRTQSQWRQTMMRALMQECLVLVFRELCRAPDCEIPWLAGIDDPHLAPAVDAMLGSPGDRHTLDTLASLTHMSRSAFAEHFQRQFGRPPITFLRDVRVREAADLLAGTDLTVDAVARRVGYASRSHFSRAFRDYFGVSPVRYRDTVGA